MKPRHYGLCTLLIFGLTLYLFTISFTDRHLISHSPYFFHPFLKASSPLIPPTNLTHILFGLLGSEEAWHLRKAYIESWWRPNNTRGLLFLDVAPTTALLPWSGTSPPYRVSDDLSFLNKSESTRAQRMVHGIMEVLREMRAEEEGEVRWVVMGDDDSIFLVENMVDVLGKYDHRRFHYLGGNSEFVLSNYLYSFNQAFGGGGIMLSYPLARALARGMEDCLKRYVVLDSADNTTRACIADIGTNLSPQKGNHQIDLRGDISGFLSAHPLSPLLSLHHFDAAEPIFPSKDRFESTRHLMAAAEADQSRLLQQTICYHRQSNWSFSISWGYSAQIYERVMPRSYLQIPIETFKPWLVRNPDPPFYMLNTRATSDDPCEAPHAFFFESVEKKADEKVVVTRYSRAWPRGLPACSSNGNYSADYIQRIQVFSPAVKRTQVDRCECCDIIGVDHVKADIRLRECMADEIIA